MPIKDDGRPLLYDRLISTKFLPVNDIPNTARAEPYAFGKIPARGVSYCLLIWRRSPEVNNWKDVKSTSMIMITEFEGSDDPNINEHTVTKIKCRISSSAVCDSAKPPEECVTLKSSLNSVLPRSTSPESRVIAPITGLQHLSNTSQITSKSVMTVNKRPSSTSASKNLAEFYMEAKGTIIIALIIAILILCTQVFLGTKSRAE
ncbi:unnamed protein product [Acanthocheilonema viteae]|uniref:Uncharacterized protein n=1 Tax=Acanthocheilonema viteae TaxID=6277 RepID=A0A498SR03_ACAVI|nr:unnamed protein product [Acanthocheilonema viteae]